MNENDAMKWNDVLEWNWIRVSVMEVGERKNETGMDGNE